MSASITVIGAGGHAKVIVGLLLASGFEINACIEDDPSLWGLDVLGVPVKGPTASLVPGTSAVLAIGRNEVRKSLSALPLQWATLVHPRAFVDPSAALGVGTVVFAGAMIQPGARIGAHAIINTGATIDHDCHVGDCAHIAPGVHLAGDVRVGEGAFLGVGANVVPGCSIGAWAIVGAGATVIGDVAKDVTVVGVPARPISRRS